MVRVQANQSSVTSVMKTLEQFSSTKQLVSPDWRNKDDKQADKQKHTPTHQEDEESDMKPSNHRIEPKSLLDYNTRPT